MAAVPFAFAAPAVAENGVHIDPNSPASKEYAIPYDAARTSRPTHHTPAANSSNQSKAQLFGSGITPVAKARAAQAPAPAPVAHTPSTSATHRRVHHVKRHHTARPVTAPAASPASSGTAVPARYSSGASGSSSPDAWMAGFGIGVLALGSLAALALSRRRRMQR